MTDNEFMNLKLEDFKLCFNRAKMGYYGKIYDRLDGQIIFEFLRAYSVERTNLKLSQNDNTHFNQKSEKFDKSEINPEGQKKVIDILRNAIKPVEEKKEVKVKEKSYEEKLVQRFMKQFDVIQMKKPYMEDLGRFIFRYGKPIGQMEYVKYKMLQFSRFSK